MEEQMVIVAMRREDLPVPHVSAELRHCHECEAEVWVSFEQILQPDFELTPEVQAICMQCFRDKVQKGEIEL